jgi:hypothetical protein
MRLRRLVVAAAAAGLLAVAAAPAQAVNCNVAASGGFINCLTVGNPSWEQAKAPNASATPYRFQLHRFATGSTWGPWTWYDNNWHTVFLSISGSVTGQVDNQGSGTQTYMVQMG